MLQQTTVAAVTPRFERFVERWPSIEALAAAEDEDILSEWAGLGYYARARNLIACAKQVAALGAFPTTEAELRRLPGIGDYTAAAIAAIAFGERTAVVDTNVHRVIARLHGLLIPSAQQVRMLVADMTPAEAPGDFAQAMMDLGVTICRPKAPLCGECPLRAACAAFACGDPEAFPAPRAKRQRPHRFGIAWWIERDDCLWLVRRPAKGLLGGMTALPGGEWSDALVGGDCPLATVRHTFTHFSLNLTVVARQETEGEGWWHAVADLGSAGLPTLYRKAVDQVLINRAHQEAA